MTSLRRLTASASVLRRPTSAPRTARRWTSLAAARRVGICGAPVCRDVIYGDGHPSRCARTTGIASSFRHFRTDRPASVEGGLSRQRLEETADFEGNAPIPRPEIPVSADDGVGESINPKTEAPKNIVNVDGKDASALLPPEPSTHPKASFEIFQERIRVASSQLKSNLDSEYEQFIHSFGQKWHSLIGKEEKKEMGRDVPGSVDDTAMDDEAPRLTLGDAPPLVGVGQSRTRRGIVNFNNLNNNNNNSNNDNDNNHNDNVNHNNNNVVEVSALTALTARGQRDILRKAGEEALLQRTAEQRVSSLLTEYQRYQSLLGATVKEMWSGYTSKPSSFDVMSLKRLLSLHSSTVKSFDSLQRQVKKYEKGIPKTLVNKFQVVKSSVDASALEKMTGASMRRLKRLIAELEDSEARMNREALDERKAFLRDRCFSKLFVEKHAPIKVKSDSVMVETRPSFTTAKTTLFQTDIVPKIEDEDDDAVPSFSGNWTGLELRRDWRESDTSKAATEGRLKSLLFDLREAGFTTNNNNLAGDVSAEDVFIRQLLDVTKLLKSHPSLRTVADEENLIPFLLRQRDSAPSHSVKRSILSETLSMCGFVSPLPRRGIRILSIDGGGIRAIMTVLLLKRIQEECGGQPLQELFDYVAGVSTGSVLAAMAAIYDCPIDDCLKLYKIISVEVFKRNIVMGASKLITSHSFYDSDHWSSLLQRDCGPLELSETARCSSIPKVAIVSSAVNLPRLTPYVFRNYNMPLNSPSKFPGTADARVWEALRASSAAPGFFEEFRIHNVLHQDGGLMVNNPTALAVHEARLLWPNEPIQCVVSLGTGRYVPVERVETSTTTGLKEKIVKLIDSATDTECVHTMLQDFLPKGSYFRFNPYMSEDILLDECRPEKVDQLLKDGDIYLRKNEDKLRTAAKRLLEPRRSWQRAGDFTKSVYLKYGQ